MLPQSEDHSRIETNLEVIQKYLTNRFPGYTITERAFPNLYYTFTATNTELQSAYKLRVDWARLVDRKNTPDRLWSILTTGFVASEMVRLGGTYYILK